MVNVIPETNEIILHIIVFLLTYIDHKRDIKRKYKVPNLFLVQINLTLCLFLSFRQ